jgi:chitinase
MSRLTKILYPLLLISSISVAMGQEKDIIGYYPSWKWKDRDMLVNPKTIPYEKLTIINYAFFIPLEDGGIVGIDTQADSNLLQRTLPSFTGVKPPNPTLIDMAHKYNVKVFLSIGGWEDSGNFPQVAADVTKRTNFAHWCVKHIEEYGFDGIDIDWEYPGYVPHNGSAHDKQNFILLLQTVRDSLDILGAKTGKYYPLSAALPASATHTANIKIEKVAEILDFLNIMTYDFYGPWESTSNHNAPLYAPLEGYPGHHLDAAFKLYNETYGIAADKINLGVPFYGHTFSGCNALHGEHQGGEKNMFSEIGSAHYYEIVDNINFFTRHWDENAQVPYLTSDSKQIFVSYDDEKSIGLKAQYVLKSNARGLIIWQIMGDYMKNGNTPLLDMIYQKFHTQ